MLHGSPATFDIGHMDRPIEIYLRRSVDTDFGFKEEDDLISTEFAQELPRTRTMKEDIMGGKEASFSEVHWRIRKETTVTTTHFLKYEGFEYDIITILPEGRDFKVLVTQLRPDIQKS